MSKNALITGISGQDGSYLAELLLDKGYNVYGILRRLSSPNTSRIDHIINSIELIQGDITDQSSLNEAMRVSDPDEVYNLAAQSFVGTSWNQPVHTADVTGIGVVRVLEAVKHLAPSAHMYQASSSEMFGKVQETPQTENTKFYPRSPYGFSKVFGYWACVNYRESYDMHISNGILFNHESPRRGIEFVTRKITDGVARIKYGLSNELRLGNLDARRDWGFAGDYVDAMWRMVQQEKPDDYVIATGETHSVQELVEFAFSRAGLDWEKYVVVDPKFVRPAEVQLLLGDATKAKNVLGWEPKVKFKELVEMMVDADLEKLKKSK
ncbi:GDPmannose 4,6-dehydratase [Methanolobus vulcani]|uniref:GDP-mannose 4,6-dehydratase n=1 Tax=Methanolobus vulcani TaxID=38026 RepID=A0A7Z7AWJ5_9EURY|nr:GDP-mannose 4,6-dehydratase [Methanolobus vulcani]SDF58414.1 GDPmannose 4,6-dehydratase [Methanolobus vulcani]